MTKKNQTAQEPEEVLEETAQEPAEETAAEELKQEQLLAEQIKQEQDKYLRLAAEYDNFRKRSQKEREALYTEVQAETIGKFLPVYDNLARALATQTADEAYKKGVEMTMTGLREVMEKLGVTVFGQVGDTFDPQRHNAVMHEENEELPENTVSQVFQEGFAIGQRVIRFAMVKVSN